MDYAQKFFKNAVYCIKTTTNSVLKGKLCPHLMHTAINFKEITMTVSPKV